MSDRVLVDTSAWTDYLRGRGRRAFDVLRLLAEDRVWLHPTVLGEVLLGGVDLGDGRLGEIPSLAPFQPDRTLAWVRTQDRDLLRGVGWADCEIVHAARAHHVPLLSADARQEALFRGAR